MLNLIDGICFVRVAVSILGWKVTDSKVRRQVKRWDHNPFVEDMVIPVKKAAVKLSRLGRDDNVLVNQATGEVEGTHVTTYRKVDGEQFVKLFTANIALTFDLKAAGVKAFNVLVYQMSDKGMSRDLVPLDKYVVEEFLTANSDREPPLKLSLPTFLRGLAELEKAQIIAKSIRQGWYYINPNFAFNGDRIAFTTVIERKPAGSEDQQELPLT